MGINGNYSNSQAQQSGQCAQKSYSIPGKISKLYCLNSNILIAAIQVDESVRKLDLHVRNKFAKDMKRYTKEIAQSNITFNEVDVILPNVYFADTQAIDQIDNAAKYLKNFGLKTYLVANNDEMAEICILPNRSSSKENIQRMDRVYVVKNDVPELEGIDLDNTCPEKFRLSYLWSWAV